MRTRSIKYPKLLTVEIDGRAVTKATKIRDIEGNRWTKQELTSVRKEFTLFCEHIIGLALNEGAEAARWLGDNAGKTGENWDHYARFSAATTAHTLELRGEIDIDGNPANYIRLWASVDLGQLESRAKERNYA